MFKIQEKVMNCNIILVYASNCRYLLDSQKEFKHLPRLSVLWKQLSSIKNQRHILIDECLL